MLVTNGSNLLAYVYVLAIILQGCKPDTASNIDDNISNNTSNVPLLIPENAGDLFKPLPSLVQVMANPSRYHNTQITVEGFLRVEFEENAIFLSDNDDQYMILSNAFWVSFYNNTIHMNYNDIANKFNGKYVILRGTFDRSEHGHMGAFQGAFKNITMLDVKRNRSEYQKLQKERREKGEMGGKGNKSTESKRGRS